MIHNARQGQVSAGEAIGILLLDTCVPFIPGDVANATTYSFPVRFQKVEGFTVARALDKDTTVFDDLLIAAKSLVQQGVRAITGDCGFMGIHQRKLAQALDVPVFLSSLIQIPFISCLIGPDAKMGVITADSKSLNVDLLTAVEVSATSNIVIAGLEDQPNFYRFAIEEIGVLDTEAVKTEIVSVARQLVADHRKVRAILLECSLIPPYGVAIQAAVNLPVFDYITMINFVFSAVVKQKYNGFI
ncbi:MAG: aspartate/glutamate racemase family protein [Thermodesulfobacteriota bacterium]|nr:aspartate/glutamate racemase family protein [Thermodesulfobacteriota bacterium]